MQSCGVVIKKDEMVMVSLKDVLGKIRLDGYSIDPFLNVAQEDRPAAITNNLERFFRKHKAGRDNFFIGLPRDQAFVCFLNMPAAVEDNLESALGYELDRYTPFSPESVYFDYHIVARLPESGLLSLMLVCIKKEAVDIYVDFLRNSKLRPMGVEITTSALFNVLHQPDVTHPFNPEMIKQELLANPYLRKILKKKPLQKKVQNKTGHPSIEILVERLNHSYEVTLVKDAMLCHSAVFSAKAEQETEQARNISPEYLSEIFSNSMKTLIHIPYNEGQTGHALNINLSGFQVDRDVLDHASEEIRDSFSVVRDFPFSVELSQSESDVLPLLSVAIGVALKGLRKPPVDINFIPPALRPKKKISREKLSALALAIFFIVLTAGGGVMTMERLEQRYSKISAELDEVRAKASQIERLKSQAESIELFSSTIEELRIGDISKLKILEELTRIIPQDSWLTEFEYKADGSRVTISGFSVSASKLIPYIESSPMFEEAKFTSPITTDRGQGNMERFRIETKISRMKKDSAGAFTAAVRG